jgi:archaellum component FlaG (FlaF/FlaG flagellin family)
MKIALMIKPKTLQLIVLLLVIALSTSAMVYALSILWQAPASVNVTQKQTKALKVYWDSGATNPVNSINWGNLEQGSQSYVTLFIKNEGTVTISLDWSSNLVSISNNYVGDDWVYYGSDGNWHSIRGYSLAAGSMLQTQYRLFIATTAPAQSYSYTLTLGSE